MATPPKKTTGPKREVKGPSFTLKSIGAELPPNPARTRTVSREELINNLVTIQASPNEWFEVAVYAARAGTEENPGGARKIVAGFLTRAIPTPEGDGEYDIEWRHANYDGSDRKGSVVCAMYVLEG